jgi:mannosyltransferase OCH1-like enzyme
MKSQIRTVLINGKVVEKHIKRKLEKKVVKRKLEKKVKKKVKKKVEKVEMYMLVKNILQSFQYSARMQAIPSNLVDNVPIVCISCNTTRQQQIIEDSKLLHLNIEFSPVTVSHTDIILNTLKFKNGRPEEKACFLSHLETANYMLKKYPTNEFVLVIEDDVFLHGIHYWKKSITELVSELPSGWEVASLHGANKNILFSPWKVSECVLGAQALIWSKKGLEKAKEILSNVKNIENFEPIDIFIPREFNSFVFHDTCQVFENQDVCILNDAINPTTKYNNEMYLDKYQTWEEQKKINIPKKFHQFWTCFKTGDVSIPIFYQKNVATIKDQHPEWTYKCWSMKEAYLYIKTYFGWFLPTFESYDKDIKRADAFRYCILFREGGVYMDLDSACLKPLDTLISVSNTAIFGYEQYNKTIIGNAFMAAPPFHPFFAFCLLQLLTTVKLGVLKSAGPCFLTKLITQYNSIVKKGKILHVHAIPILYTHEWRKTPHSISKIRRENPSSYVTTFWSSSWHNGNWGFRTKLKGTRNMGNTENHGGFKKDSTQKYNNKLYDINVHSVKLSNTQIQNLTNCIPHTSFDENQLKLFKQEKPFTMDDSLVPSVKFSIHEVFFKRNHTKFNIRDPFGGGEKLHITPTPKLLQSLLENISLLYCKHSENQVEKYISERLCGLAALQIHCGGEDDEKKTLFEPIFHNDSTTSVLHFSITLAGSRDVIFESHDDREDIKVTLQKGDMYSGPMSHITHGVRHTQRSWENRSMSLQIRMFDVGTKYSPDELYKAANALHNKCAMLLQDVFKILL